MTSPDLKPDFDELLRMLKEARGFDFTGYKPSTLQRRIQRRMTALDLSTFGEYRDYLELQPDEFTELFNSMLINVTGFFRDPAAWQVVSGTVVPALLSAKGPRTPIRVWSAGCATGEEAYTLAMILTEAMGPEPFRERVKIYATDLDEDALQQARYGTYEARALDDVPEGLREIYFERAGTRFAFRCDLRRQVIFGRNDLTHDAPISHVDLLVSRNTLMYFNADTQTSIIQRFHFALSDPGYLFLGKAEMLLNHADRFQAVDLRKRVFLKLPSGPRAMGQPGSWAGDAPLFAAPGDLIERAHEELQSLHEELETTNEELETTNEELQSTNEELETINEELQSTNDELQTINDELRLRTDELDQANGFLGSVLRSLGSAVIVLDEDLSVRIWSPGAEDMWGLRADEAAGMSLPSLDIGLPTEVIAPHLRSLLKGARGGAPALELAAVNRRGKTVDLRIAASPLRTEEGAVSGVILVIDHAAPGRPRRTGETPGELPAAAAAPGPSGPEAP